MSQAVESYSRAEAEKYIIDSSSAWAESVATDDASVVKRILADDLVWLREGKVLDKIRGLMMLITLAALASAGLTVWSVMATTVLERRGEIAIMQATGAGNGLVAALFSTEVALEGAIGGLIGSWVGLLLAAWVGRAVFQTALETPAMLGPVVVGAAVLAAVAGAAQPLRRALLLEPAVALRGGE